MSILTKAGLLKAEPETLLHLILCAKQKKMQFRAQNSVIREYWLLWFSYNFISSLEISLFFKCSILIGWGKRCDLEHKNNATLE